MTAATIRYWSLGAAWLLLPACADPPPKDEADPAPVPLFDEVTESLGLDFRHRVEAGNGFFMPDIVGSGGALEDFDGDGDLDLYLVNSGRRRGPSPAGANRYFRREADGSFRESSGSGAEDDGYGMGCAVGDVDNDGDLDLLVTNFGSNRLFQNLGGGRFRDVSSEAGIGGDQWSTSAVFFDYDRDGFLDLYVANYLDYDGRGCHDTAGRPDFCGPEAFRGVPDRLYRNRGDGSFEDRSEAAGIARVAGKGLGVLAADLDGDGWTDLYVANDGEANQLWINRGDGTFEDEAPIRGAAFNLFGKSEASMGVAAGDVDGDGDLDLFMTHLDRETNTLYLNDGAGEFDDRTAGSGLGTASLPYTGFGTLLTDFDQDGDLDLFAANGRVRRGTRSGGGSGGDHPEWEDYSEPNLLFRNLQGRFADVSARAGTLTSRVEVSRAAMVGDLDGDGDPDLVLTNSNGPARIFANSWSPSGGWLRLQVRDESLGRDAIGARVTVKAGSRQWIREVSHGSGYLASSPATLHFGLGEARRADSVQVRWPDGSREEFPALPAGQTVTIRKGEGRPVD